MTLFSSTRRPCSPHACPPRGSEFIRDQASGHSQPSAGGKSFAAEAAPTKARLRLGPASLRWASLRSAPTDGAVPNPNQGADQCVEWMALFSSTKRSRSPPRGSEFIRDQASGHSQPSAGGKSFAAEAAPTKARLRLGPASLRWASLRSAPTDGAVPNPNQGADQCVEWMALFSSTKRSRSPPRGSEFIRDQASGHSQPSAGGKSFAAEAAPTGEPAAGPSSVVGRHQAKPLEKSTNLHIRRPRHYGATHREGG